MEKDINDDLRKMEQPIKNDLGENIGNGNNNQNK